MIWAACVDASRCWCLHSSRCWCLHTVHSSPLIDFPSFHATYLCTDGGSTCVHPCVLCTPHTSKIKANFSFLCQSSALISVLSVILPVPLCVTSGSLRWMGFPWLGRQMFSKGSIIHSSMFRRKTNKHVFFLLHYTQTQKISVDNGWSLKKSPLPCNVGGLRHWPFISVSVVGIGPVIYSETNVSAIHNAQPIQPSICIHSWLVIDKDKDNKNTNTQKLKKIQKTNKNTKINKITKTNKKKTKPNKTANTNKIQTQT